MEYSKSWEVEIDKTRWMIGFEWYKELGWVKISFAVFTITIWWKQRPYYSS